MLGATYLKLVKSLSLSIPAIDPSLFISRFASLLEFGEETQQVANDAVRLVQRFSRDWMDSGRRPAGICGACLLLAARMNNFRRSVAEVVQVVKIADTTLQKRLTEFNQTASSSLSISDFRNVWLNERADPPAFTEGLKRDKEKLQAAAAKKKRITDAGQQKGIASSSSKKVRFNTTGGVLSDEEEGEDEEIDGENDDQDDPDIDPQLLENGQKKRRRKNDEALARGLQALEEIRGEGGFGGSGTRPNASADTNEDDADHARAGDHRIVNAEADFDELNQEMAALQETGGAGLAEEEEEGIEGGDVAVDVEVDEEDEETMLDAIAAREGADREGSADPTGIVSEGGADALNPKKVRNLSLQEQERLRAAHDARTEEERIADEQVDQALSNEISSELNSNKIFQVLSSELQEKEQTRWKIAQSAAYPHALDDNDRLSDLDEEELDAFILTEEEVKIKERLWMEFNKDYLANVAEKHLRAELDEKPLKKRDRKVSVCGNTSTRFGKG